MAAPAAAGCTVTTASTAAAVTGTVESCTVAHTYQARITAAATATRATSIAVVAGFIVAPASIEAAESTAAARHFTGTAGMSPIIAAVAGVADLQTESA